MARVAPLLAVVAGCSFSGLASDDGPSGADSRPRDDAPIDPRPDARRPDARVDARIDASPIDAPPIDAAMPDAAPCPSSYTDTISSSTSRYRIVTSAARWISAETDCENDGTGTHLIVVDDNAERVGLDALVDGSTWIGVTDRVTENTWLRVTGGVQSLLPWSSNQPDNFFGEDCVEQLESGSWNDIDCQDNFRDYVCECDGIAADPAAY